MYADSGNEGGWKAFPRYITSLEVVVISHVLFLSQYRGKTEKTLF